MTRRLFAWFVVFLHLQAMPGHASVSTESATPPLMVAPFDDEVSLERALDLAITYNYDVRTRAEEVFRARQNIYVAIGRLIPNLNFTLALALGYQAYVDAALIAAGFLFPSNWFRWRESKLFFEAERSNFAVLLANQAYAVESLYYRLGALEHTLEIYTQYIGVAERLLEQVPVIIPDQALYAKGYRELNHLRLNLTADRQNVLRTLGAVYPEFYQALGLDSAQWERYHIAEIGRPDISVWPERAKERYHARILARSQELRALTYLGKASRFATYTRAFDFISPSAGAEGGLGFGTLASIKIGRSYTKEFEIRYAKAESELRRALDQSLADYHWSIASYATHSEQLVNAKAYLEMLKERFFELHYFGDDLADAVTFMVTAELGLNENRRLAMTAKANLNRLMWRGTVYDKALSIAFAKKPDKRLRWAQYIENAKIKHAERHGELALPAR